MTNDFQPVDGGIRVRDADGRFQPVQTPEGFTDHAFRNAVAAYYTAYRTLGKRPTVNEVQNFWANIPAKTYAALFLTDEFKQALRYRGVEWDDDAGLSMEQSMVLMKLSDPFDKRSTTVKLKDLQVPMARYQAWLKQPLFMQALNTQTKNNYQEALPLIRNKLIGNAEAGDQRAIELVFAITGEWNPAQMQIEDARTVVLATVEAVIKHVTDPDVRKAIMADVALTAGTLGVLHPQQQMEG